MFTTAIPEEHLSGCRDYDALSRRRAAGRAAFVGSAGRKFVEARCEIRKLNRELLATAMAYRDEREVAAQQIVY